MSKVGHHRVSLEGTKLVLGKPVHNYADYFEKASQFYGAVEDWITNNHPSLKK